MSSSTCSTHWSGLAALIDWAEIERTFAVSFTSGRCRPALASRLVAGLLYLQHTFDASDEAVVNTWGASEAPAIAHDFTVVVFMLVALLGLPGHVGLGIKNGF